jgi:purine-nucleoside/S-methyl-5'-thioadenosine phosphorylase / adenosine deaminase
MIPFRPFSGVSGGFVGRDVSALESMKKNLSDFIQLKQIHSDRIHLLTESRQIGETRDSEGDAIISGIKGVAVAVRAADCVPILIAHPDGIVAAVHAGWKGTAAELLKKTLIRMKENFDLDLSQAFLSIGPAICGRCYEVGEEVASRFVRFDGVVKALSAGKFLLDLRGINRLLAQEAGVLTEHIETRPECTLCDEKDFYSYRGEIRRGDKGDHRNYAWVMLE